MIGGVRKIARCDYIGARQVGPLGPGPGKNGGIGNLVCELPEKLTLVVKSGLFA